MIWTGLASLALVASCNDYPTPTAPTDDSRIALITAIRYPDGVNFSDDVTIRFSVVVNPCESFYYAEDHPDGDAMRFSARTVPAPCVSAAPTTQEVEFFLQGPQRLPRQLIFREPDGVDSVRILTVKSSPPAVPVTAVRGLH